MQSRRDHDHKDRHSRDRYSRDRQGWDRQLCGLTLPLEALIFAAVALGPGSGLAATYPQCPGVQVVDIDVVLADHTEPGVDGSLFFVDSIGARWRLVTSPADPVIANAGDGAFHPVERADIDAVIDAIPARFLAPVSAAIFVLPYPRAACLASSADDHAIYLSPGSYAYSAAQAAALIAHELGHAVHRALLPDSDTEGWAEYAALRGIADSTLYRGDAAHAYRPHEVFAEDFRVLFGGALAAGSGAVENLALASPQDLPEIRAFFERLALRNLAPSVAAEGAGLAAPSWVACPNPSHEGQAVTLLASRTGMASVDATPAGPATVLVFDAAGREIGRQEVSSLAMPVPVPTRDGSGHELTAGAYWARIVPAEGAAVTVSFRRTR